MFIPFLTVILAPVVLAQIVYDSAHNTTPIIGTWSTGSKQVSTGSGFANPANESFIYPKTTGVSYSFTDDGFYEVARYRFNSNATEPSCITGVLNWHHGTYQLVDNGSIILTPFGDGYQQIQDPCAAVSNFIEGYNDTELYQSWQIFTDPTDGPKLHMFNFDGSPVAPQFQLSATPNMLPTQLLRNVTPSTSLTSQSLFVNAGGRSWSPASVLMLGTQWLSVVKTRILQ
ncbi:Protein rot1 [Grifola frondosa]|uniref:Protein ROT1 n=1 Tax=Grifola frondosa TaxID=5627 RepID=A0A1C7M2U7_GRIFR|nr:Protein rot1 [Grifola frondosa]